MRRLRDKRETRVLPAFLQIFCDALAEGKLLPYVAFAFAPSCHSFVRTHFAGGAPDKFSFLFPKPSSRSRILISFFLQIGSFSGFFKRPLRRRRRPLLCRLRSDMRLGAAGESFANPKGTPISSTRTFSFGTFDEFRF